MRLSAVALALLTLTAADRALACGGGLVTTRTASVDSDAQRIFLAFTGGTTTVVTQIAVPATSADYGVLIPLPARPTLDPKPVPTAAFDELEGATAPLLIEGSSGGFSLGCGGGASKGLRGGGGPGVSVSAPVPIGPVTAVVLTADDGTAVNEWLAANAFALSDEGRSLVVAYSGPGHFFVALRRNDRAVDGSPTGVGVRFTLPGDQRALPLRFARLGAAARVAFTVFVAADAPAGPEAPFQAITLDQLDARLVAENGYPAAVAQAVASRGGHAFVVESVKALRVLPPDNALLAGLPTDSLSVTRLSTIVGRDALTVDASLAGLAPSPVPDRLVLPSLASAGSVTLLALGGLLTWRRRRRTLPSA